MPTHCSVTRSRLFVDEDVSCFHGMNLTLRWMLEPFRNAAKAGTAILRKLRVGLQAKHHLPWIALAVRGLDC